MCEARLQTRIGKPQREQTGEQKRGLDPKPEGRREEADTKILGSQTPSSRLVMSGGQWVSQREGRSFQKPRGFWLLELAGAVVCGEQSPSFWLLVQPSPLLESSRQASGGREQGCSGCHAPVGSTGWIHEHMETPVSGLGRVVKQTEIPTDSGAVKGRREACRLVTGGLKRVTPLVSTGWLHLKAIYPVSSSIHYISSFIR